MTRIVHVGSLVLTIAVAGATGSACMHAKAASVADSPPLDMPLPPPRVVETAEGTPLPPAPLAEEPPRQEVRPHSGERRGLNGGASLRERTRRSPTSNRRDLSRHRGPLRIRRNRPRPCRRPQRWRKESSSGRFAARCCALRRTWVGWTIARSAGTAGLSTTRPSASSNRPRRQWNRGRGTFSLREAWRIRRKHWHNSSRAGDPVGRGTQAFFNILRLP